MPGLPEVRIGIVGYGMMGKAHSYGYREAPRLRDLPVRPRLRLISGRRRELVEKAASAYGVEEVTTDWRRIVERKDIDIVDICTPPGTHAEIAAAAAASRSPCRSDGCRNRRWSFRFDRRMGGRARDGAQLRSPPMRLHHRGQRHEGDAAVRLCTPQRAPIRRWRRCR